MEVGFDRSSLARLWVAAAVAVGGGVRLALGEFGFPGVEVPPWLRITFGVLAVVMGSWFGYAAAQAPQPMILGDRVFEVATTRPEGLRASRILVGSRFVAGDLCEVRNRLAAALG